METTVRSPQFVDLARRWAWGRSIACLALCCLLASRAPAQTEKAPVIRSIEIRGLQTIDRRQVLRALPIKEGEPMPTLAPGRLIQDVYATGFFQHDIRCYEEPVGEGAVKIILEVKENPIISDLKVEGAEKIASKDLLSVIGYKTGDMLKSGAAEDIRRAVENEYRLKGYYEASARIETAPDPKDSGKAAVRIIAIEGMRRRLKDVIIEGNENIWGFTLRLGLENKGSWGPIRNYYNDRALEDDMERIRMRYINKGFLNVDVSSGGFKTGGEGKSAWISPVIKIKEGPRYRVEEIKVRGAMLFGEGEIAAFFSNMVGSAYAGEKARTALEKVKQLYGDAGYVNAQISVDFETNDVKGAVAVIVAIKENSQVRVGRVRIARKTAEPTEEAPFYERWYAKIAPPISDRAIEREVQLKSGEVYRSYQEARTRRRLESLGVFDSIQIRREPTPDPGVSDAVIEVEEGVTGNLVFGVGYGDVSHGFVFAEYTERNLFGEARDLSVRGQLGQRSSYGSIGYLDRHYRGGDVSLGVDLFYTRDLWVGYTERHTGGAVTASWPWDDDTRLNVRVKSYLVDLHPEHHHTHTAEDLDKDYVVASIRPGVTIDKRDDEYFPTKGSLFGAGVELGYADGFLGKFDVDLEHFTPLPADLVWATRAGFGIMPVDAGDVGISERYFLGGSENLRGFRPRGAGPKDSKDGDVAIGGSSIALWQNELRYPITKQFNILAFVDAGMIGREPLEYESPRVSAGVGARLRVRFASIALDFGAPIVKKSKDQTEFLHFRLGSRF